MKLIKRIILTFILFLTITTVKVEAGTNDTNIVIKMIPNVYSNKETPYQNFWIQFDYVFINDKIAFCIQPGIRLTTRNYSSTTDFSSFNLSLEDKRNLELISYYGYYYPSHQTLEYYMATQELIWRYLGITNLNFTTGPNYSGDVIDIEKYKNEIKSLIEKNDLRPSFNQETKTAIVGDLMIYEDTNGVLNDYEITDSNGNVSWISDNKLYVNVSKKGLSEIKLKRKKYNNNTSFVYLADNSQTLATFGFDNEEITSNIYIDGIYKGIVSLEKTGNYISDINNGDFIYEEKPLENVSYQIYADEDIYESNKLIYSKGALVDNLITNNLGESSSKMLPIGSYCILENEVNDYYIIDDNNYCFTFNESEAIDSIVYQKYSFKNELKLGTFKLEKVGEVVSNIHDNAFNYELVGLPNVKFGVFASVDIYNTNDELLVSKNELLFDVLTSKDGIIDIILPIGSYYIQELEAPIEYEIDDTKYYFDINIDNLNYESDIIINKLKKVNLSVTKMDSDTNELLSDTVYNLYNNDNEIIMELTTSNEGKIELELPFGKYFLKEIKSRYGYLIDNTIYELNVLDEDINLELYNKKIPMPITTDYQNSIKIISFFAFIIGVLLIYASKNKSYN